MPRSDVTVGRPESLKGVQERMSRLISDQESCRPPANVARGRFVIVGESSIPRRIIHGFRVTHSGLLEGMTSNGEPCVVMRGPEREGE
jgi:hypothetical protein